MRRWLAVLLLLLAACSTYREHVNRGQRMYDENEYEKALALWRYLEDDVDTLDWPDQVRYAYLRGMTDFRLGFEKDARHWLAIAKALEQEHPGGLKPEWKQRLNDTLDKLNRPIFGTEDELSKSASTVVETRTLGGPDGGPVTDGGAATKPDLPLEGGI